MIRRVNKEIGNLGEEIACRFLQKKGFKIIERNYKKKFGEIDIIGEKRRETYFFEVKMNSVNSKIEAQRPEERVDAWKLHQIGKVARVYLEEKGLQDSDWYFRVISVLFDPEKRIARVKIIENVVPE